MLDQLRDQFAAYLAEHKVAILSGAAPDGVWALPVGYTSVGLALHCQIPRWADAAYYLEQTAPVTLIIPASTDAERWLLCSGAAHVAVGNAQYCSVAITLHRLDLFDGRRGWGARDTLECA